MDPILTYPHGFAGTLGAMEVNGTAPGPTTAKNGRWIPKSPRRLATRIRMMATRAVVGWWLGPAKFPQWQWFPHNIGWPGSEPKNGDFPTKDNDSDDESTNSQLLLVKYWVTVGGTPHDNDAESFFYDTKKWSDFPFLLVIICLRLGSTPLLAPRKGWFSPRLAATIRMLRQQLP